MKNILFILIISFLLIANYANSQSNPTAVVYKQYSNGNYSEGQDFELIVYKKVCHYKGSNEKIKSYADFTTNENISTIELDGTLYKVTKSFDSLMVPKYEDKIDTILGYRCSYAKYLSFSNTIEVWYTEDAKFSGSPYQSYLPTKESLVLKITINGNRDIIASEIKEISKKTDLEYDLTGAVEITRAEFEELIIMSRYKTLNVFNHNTINFDPGIEKPNLEEADNTTIFSLSAGTIILKKVNLSEHYKNGDYVFAKLVSWSNGDAYDRTGSLFMIPAKTDKNTMLEAFIKDTKVLPVYKSKDGSEFQGICATANYEPPIELMRFFTSFGARHFNKLREINNYTWADSVIFEQDVTSLIPSNQDEVWIGAFIGNYDKGGHKLSLDLEFFPSFDIEEPAQKYVQPMFNTLNVLEMSGQNYGRLFKTDTLKIEFEITETLENAKLLFTTTGHGGWGNGDEFVPKLNQLFLDGKPLFSIVPWRTDCASYRLLNPASGNFANGLSSSDLSRSNWCPGTLTPPYIIPLNNIELGKHTIEIVIDQGDDEGSSFSHWSVSGTIVGNIE